MKLEFEEFFSSPLPNLVRGPDKKVFLRNKVAPEVKTFATYLYLNGSSYRQVQRLLENLGIKVAHSAVWCWLQRAGELAENIKAQKKERSVLAVDETKIRVQGARSGFSPLSTPRIGR